MSALSTAYMTLLDWAKRLDPTGKTAKVVEMLNQTNEMLQHMPWLEGNLPTGHRTTIRTGLPTPAWRMFNQGVQPTKSRTAQVDESCGMLEDYSQVDKDLAELNGNTAEFRLSEASAHLEGINQELQQTIIYGNGTTAPAEFTGLANRFSSRSANNGQNIISGGGSGSDNTSIWLVVWGPNTVHGIFPKGSMAGIKHTDKGLVTVENAGGVTGALMEAYRDHWQVKAGISVRDWRQCVRIANIDISDDNADIVDLMIKAVHRVQNLTMGKAYFYMNRTMHQRLDLLRRNDIISGGGLTWDTVDGVRKSSFRGIPIGVVDAILETEATVS